MTPKSLGVRTARTWWMVMMTYQTVPLPLNAAEKLAEAGYFFNRMLALQHNVREFVYNLSAFLSALRGIMDKYLPKQFSKHPGFNDWCDRTCAEHKADPILSALVQLRIETVHLNPIKEVYYQAGPPIPAEGIDTKHFEFTHTTDAAGNMLCTLKVDSDGETVSVQPVVRWVFRLPEEHEVLTTCRHGLERMHAMLKEWQAILEQSPE
jgi:hypothetical protein